MANPISSVQGVPQRDTPFVEPTGLISLPWFRLLVALFNRTGGGVATGALLAVNNLDDLEDIPVARGHLGLGTAALLNAGTGANQLVQMGADDKLPVVDGSKLTGVNPDIIDLPLKAAPLAADSVAIFDSVGGANARATLGTISVFSRSFVSTDQTISAAGVLTVPHGLGIPPLLLTYQYVCAIAELGFSPGDLIDVGASTSSTNGRPAFMTYCDATNIGVTFTSVASGAGIIFNDKGTGAPGFITYANWLLRIKAFV